MTVNDFIRYLNNSNQVLEDRIVYMRYKYSWENKWTYSKEILLVDLDVADNYVWYNDWYEGQEDVEILGCILVSAVNVPMFGGETND